MDMDALIAELSSDDISYVDLDRPQAPATENAAQANAKSDPPLVRHDIAWGGRAPPGVSVMPPIEGVCVGNSRVMVECGMRFIQCLPDEDLSTFKSNFGTTLLMSTTCSGSDNCVDVMVALSTAIFELFGIDHTTKHIFSCDSAEYVRKYLQSKPKAHRSEQLFGDSNTAQ